MAEHVAAPSVWQSIGPDHVPNGQTYGTNRVDVIGRVSSIAIDPSNTKHILLGSAGGGIWESKDSGANWQPRTDKMPSLAIGAVVFDPRNRKRVYAGSGEGNFYASRGAGVYRSIDGGTTWAVQASAPFVGVGFYDLVVDPKTRSILYAATTNGFYKSTNRGSTWSLKRAGRCWDISVHPGGGKIELLAAFQDGVFASTNGGNTFTAVTLPSTPSAPGLGLQSTESRRRRMSLMRLAQRAGRRISGDAAALSGPRSPRCHRR
jgi:BNR/Asp-box repeat.